MKAITQKTYGAPTVLSIATVERPVIGEGEVLVEVRASTITEGDRRLRAADYPGLGKLFGRLMMGFSGPRNRIPGTMFAGRVVAVGGAVTRFAVGDDVFGSCMHGAHAEYLAIPEDSPVAPMPTTVDYAEAAAIPYGAGTALVFLRDLAKVQSGERVLIVGASGGVGRAAVQLAHHLGAEVTGVCSRDEDLVRALGATHVINYQQQDFMENGERYDVIFDTQAENLFARARHSLTPRGRYLSLYMSTGLLLQALMTAFIAGPRALTGVALPKREHIETLGALLAEGALRAVIARRYPVTQIADAHVFLEAGRTRGSVVVEMAELREATATTAASTTATAFTPAVASGQTPRLVSHRLTTAAP